MDKKEKISFVKKQFLRFMRKKQEIVDSSTRAIKQFAYDNSHGLRRIFAGAMLVSSLGLGGQAKADTPEPHADSDIKRRHEMKDTYIKTNIVDSTYVADMAEFSKANVKTEGVYNGHHLNFKTARPENVVHIFEAGGNQTILDKKNIKDANYIGDFQFNLNNTIYELAKYCRKDFPQLAQAAGVDVKTGRILAKNARTQEFYETWCNLCKGENSEQFSRLRFNFMFKTHYKPVFDKLHEAHPDFPLITPENYAKPENFLFSTMVMGTATQSPGSAFKIINKQINEAKALAKKQGIKEISPLDVYKRVADRKIKLWGYAKRYNAEKKIAADITAYFQSVAGIPNIEKTPEQAKPVVAQATTSNKNKSNKVKTVVVNTPEQSQTSKSVVAENTQEKRVVKARFKAVSMNKTQEKPRIVATRTPIKIEKKLQKFVRVANEELIAKNSDKEVPPMETPMVERADNGSTKVVKDVRTSTDKRAKVRKIIERKKAEVRVKIAQRQKNNDTTTKKNVYVVRQRDGVRIS